MKKNNTGRRNIPLNEMWKWYYVETTIHNVMKFFNYLETRPPILLSDDVVKKIYNSGDDKKDLDNLLSKLYRIDCDKGLNLRPDGTVTYLSEFQELSEGTSVNRIYYIGPMFRRSVNEPHKDGQFHQFGAEALGSDSYIIDIEIIRLGLHILKKFGLTDISVELGNFGCKECRPSFLKELKNYWNSSKQDLCNSCGDSFVQFIAESAECSTCKSIWQKSPSIFDFLCDACKENFRLIKRALSNLMINYTVKSRMKMNFDYYNRLVFRYSLTYARKTHYIGGGGRYDYLAQSITGKPLSAIGLSACIEELISILDKRNLFTEPENPFKVFVMATHPDLEITLLQLVQELHSNDISVIAGHTDKDSRNHIDTAISEGASVMIVLDDIRIRDGKATINNLVKEHSEIINLSAILTNVKRIQKSLSNNYY